MIKIFVSEKKSLTFKQNPFFVGFFWGGGGKRLQNIASAFLLTFTQH